MLAGPAYRLLGKKDFGTKGDYLTDKMPAVNALIGGELAWRQHDGGHTNTPNFPAFYIALFQNPTSTNAIHLTGQGKLTVAGVLYAPRARINITGQGGLVVNQDPASGVAQVIVFGVTVTGSGGLTVNV